MDDFIVISVWPSNPMPFINLVVSNLVALSARPVRFDLMPAEVDIVNPIAKLLNPEIELPAAGVNALLDIIPNTVSSTVKNITGLVLPSESISVPDLVLVSPNPSAFSGPINTHRFSIIYM